MERHDERLPALLNRLVPGLGFAWFGVTSPLPEHTAAFATGSLVVLAYPYQDGEDAAPGEMHISSYYVHEHKAYHAATRLVEALMIRDPAVRAHLDSPYKAYAKRAGLAYHGRNALAQNPALGSRFILQMLHTGHELPIAEEGPAGALSPACEGCTRCVRACPTGALDGQGNLDIQRCLRFWMQSGKTMPLELRGLMGNRLLGCEACQRACPQNAGKPRKTPEDLLPFLCLEPWMRMGEAQFSAYAKKLGSVLGPNMVRPKRLKAQLSILAGNQPSALYLDTLGRWAADENEALRAHAEWAIQRIKDRG